MIIPIRNQPIVFEGVEADPASCGDDSTYCQLVRLGDKLCFQLRQESCLPQLLCNNDFSTFSDDYMSGYGDFTLEAEFDDWTSDPLTWEWDEYGRRACTLDVGDHVGGDLTFNIDLYGLDPTCTTFILTFEISGYEAPVGEPSDADLTVTLPDGTTQVITTNGAYSFPTGVGSSFSFTPGLNWSGCVDTITLLCGGTCWDFDFPIPEKNPISLSGSGLCKVLVYVNNVTEQTPTLTIGKYYQIYVKVEGASEGSIEFFLGTESIGTVDENGIFTLSGVSDGTEFSFVMSEFFDGCISYIQLYQLSKDYTLKLYDSSDDSEIADLTDSLLYGEEIKEGTRGDLLQACIHFDQELLNQMIEDCQGVGEGFECPSFCMYLEIESPADGNVVTGGTFEYEEGEGVVDDWGSLSGLTFEAIQGQLEITGGTGYILQDLSGAGFVQGNTYYVAFDINCLDHGDTDPDFDSFTASLGSMSDGTLGTMVWDSTNFPTQTGHYIYKVTAGSDGDYLAFYFDDSAGLSKICIDNVVVRTTPCAHELYQSNCIKFARKTDGVEAWEGSKLVTACNEEGSSFGFDWSTGFKLQSRLYMSIVTPRYPSKEDDTYLQSNSERKRVFADSAKVFDLLVSPVDELAHDMIRTMLKCDVLYIDTDYTLTNRYVHIESEYAPNWDSKGILKVTDASTEIQKYDNTIFNTNCR